MEHRDKIRALIRYRLRHSRREIALAMALTVGAIGFIAASMFSPDRPAGSHTVERR